MTLTQLRSATTPAAPRALPARAPAPPADQAARQSRESRAAPLSLRCVTKRWRGARVAVLDRVTLALEPATMTWIGGRNGVGKTTLLRIAAGLIEPDTGEVEVWGESARENRVRYQRLVSLLAAGDRGLYARLSVRGHLDFCARIAMLPRSELQRAVARAIEEFGLEELAGRRVDRISMGQRQRLRMAMAFLARPEIVLLDEPLTSLDADGAEILRCAIAEVLARDGAVLWCSPERELRARFDARFALEHGRLVGA